MSVCLPKVDFFAKTDYAVFSESNYDKAFNDQRKDNTFIGFTLTLNLFDGFNTTGVVNTATQRIASAQADPESRLKNNERKWVMSCGS